MVWPTVQFVPTVTTSVCILRPALSSGKARPTSISSRSSWGTELSTSARSPSSISSSTWTASSESISVITSATSLAVRLSVTSLRKWSSSSKSRSGSNSVLTTSMRRLRNGRSNKPKASARSEWWKPWRCWANCSSVPESSRETNWSKRAAVSTLVSGSMRWIISGLSWLSGMTRVGWMIRNIRRAETILKFA